MVTFKTFGNQSLNGFMELIHGRTSIVFRTDISQLLVYKNYSWQTFWKHYYSTFNRLCDICIFFGFLLVLSVLGIIQILMIFECFR